MAAMEVVRTVPPVRSSRLSNLVLTYKSIASLVQTPKYLVLDIYLFKYNTLEVLVFERKLRPQARARIGRVLSVATVCAFNVRDVRIDTVIELCGPCAGLLPLTVALSRR